MKHSVLTKIGAMMLAAVMVLSLGACGTQLDQNPGQQTEPAAQATQPVQTTAPAETQAPTESDEDVLDVDAVDDKNSDLSKYDEKDITVQKDQNGNVVISDGNQNGQDQYLTDAVPEGQQMPVEPGDVEIDTSTEKTCYLTVNCSTIHYNMDDLTEGKEVLVPDDGILFPRTAVTFYEGESVFDVLQREMRNNRIHMSSRFTPIYNSAYIEAIGNLYEFDCGSGSGWMYNVNGWYPNYGVSRYLVQEGDEIQFNYTCDLGRDLGTDMGLQG